MIARLKPVRRLKNIFYAFIPLPAILSSYSQKYDLLQRRLHWLGIARLLIFVAVIVFGYFHFILPGLVLADHRIMPAWLVLFTLFVYIKQ